ncbi:hypothetical protein ABEB36_000517 [Hypothenemus hampei]|uniref:Uncharacterized protein n=1 Tax=Hypothenemus hampei TaxID=57062 RepID=A0ABD1FC37_HYPHA
MSTNNPALLFDPTAPITYKEWSDLINSILSFVTASTHLASILRNNRYYFPQALELIGQTQADAGARYNLTDFPWFLNELTRTIDKRNYHITQEESLIQYPIQELALGEPNREPRTITLVDTSDFGDVDCKKPEEVSLNLDYYTDSDQTIDSLNLQENFQNEQEQVIKGHNLNQPSTSKEEREQLYLECDVEDVVKVERRPSLKVHLVKMEEEISTNCTFNVNDNAKENTIRLNKIKQKAVKRKQEAKEEVPIDYINKLGSEDNKIVAKLKCNPVIKNKNTRICNQTEKNEMKLKRESIRTDFVTKNIVNIANKKNPKPKNLGTSTAANSSSKTLPKKTNSIEIKSCWKNKDNKVVKFPRVVSLKDSRDVPTKPYTVTGRNEFQILPKLSIARDRTLKLSAAETLKKATEMLKDSNHRAAKRPTTALNPK